MVNIFWFCPTPADEYQLSLENGLVKMVNDLDSGKIPNGIHVKQSEIINGRPHIRFSGRHNQVVKALLTWQTEYPNLFWGIANTLNILYRTHPDVKLNLTPLSLYSQFRHFGGERHLLNRMCETKHKMKYLYGRCASAVIRDVAADNPEKIKSYEKTFFHPPISSAEMWGVRTYLRDKRVVIASGVVTPMDHQLRCWGVDIRNAVCWESKQMGLSRDPYFQSTYLLDFEYKHRLSRNVVLVAGSTDKLLNIFEWVPAGTEIITIGIPVVELFMSIKHKQDSPIMLLNTQKRREFFLDYQHYVKI